MLSDRDLRHALHAGDLTVTPLQAGAVQPASIDLRLGDQLATPDGAPYPIGGGCWLNPGVFLLGHTAETIGLSPALAARLEGKSTLGRRGLVVHVTAGFIDPGFRGQITLELANLSADPVWLEAGMRVSQLSVYRLSSPAAVPYGSAALGSHYQGQSGPVPAHDR